MSGVQALDLTTCDREPIHVPGAIQPHGALLHVGPDLKVLQASANLGTLAGIEAADAVGRSVADVMGDAVAAAVARTLDVAKQGLGQVPDLVSDVTGPQELSKAGRTWDLMVHRGGAGAIVEIERRPADGEDAAGPGLAGALPRLAACADVPTLLRAAVVQLRSMTGFDRVMAYRFDGDGHGEVVAEELRPGLAPYLGLVYPASDVPRQARELYLRSWVRSIPDSAYTPVPLVPPKHPQSGEPLDLGMAVLRSVSPIHLEYMRNMGLTASLSVSLVVQGRLWGMLSCGHEAGPLHVGATARKACEALGRLVSFQVAALEELSVRTARAALQAPLEVLGRAVAAQPANVVKGLMSEPEALLAVAKADGVAIVEGEDCWTHGHTPDAVTVREVARYAEQVETSGRHQTDRLPHLLPSAAADAADCSGLRSLSLPGDPRRRVLWFRRERARLVTWAGDPRKAASASPDGRLHPRRSFAQWQEQVRMRSLPWQEPELDATDALRRRLIEADLAIQLRRATDAVRARDDVVAVLSHDLKTPLSVLQIQAALLRQAGAQPTDEAVERIAQRVASATSKMEALVRDMLDVAGIEAGRFVVHPDTHDAAELVGEAASMLAPLAARRRQDLRVDAQPGLRVLADPDRIFQVLANLMGNAIKFTPEGGRVMVAARREPGDAFVRFEVADTGPGLPESLRPHLFQRFRPEGAAAGSGLGLFISRGIVEAHGGTIAAGQPTHGASLSFTLPAVDA